MSRFFLPTTKPKHFPISPPGTSSPTTQPRRYRNRRIGEFLKELEFTEGRATGIPKILHAMSQNGSPPPDFEFDDDHSYFMVRLPVHPAALEVAESVVGEEHKPARAQVTGQVAGQVQRLLDVCEGEMSRNELQKKLALKHRDSFNEAYLQPALEAGLLEMTIPKKPRSSKQRYRLTMLRRSRKARLAIRSPSMSLKFPLGCEAGGRACREPK